MAKVKYYAKENSSIGTHSFYAVPDYKERMKAEYDELKERTEKLNAFFGTDLFASLSDEKKQLMQEQHVAMVKYLDTLGRRCQLEGI